MEIRRRPPKRPRGGPSCLLVLLVIAAFAALPRMAGYDAFVFGPMAFAAFLPAEGDGSPRRAQWAAYATLLAGLFKEGLAALPLLALVTLVLDRRTSRGEDEEPRQARTETPSSMSV